MAQIQGGATPSHSDAVMVISVWKQEPERFLGRVTMTDAAGESSTHVVDSPDMLLESVQDWVGSLK